jgi:hypothetical protein
LLAVIDALKLLPAIRRRRREERSVAKRSDLDVFHIFREVEKEIGKNKA